MSASPIAGAHVRIGRPTNNIAGLRKFYIDGLGLSVLFEFSGHDGFDGLMLGLGGHGYHLEFTSTAGHDAGRAPSEDHLLVFYLPDKVQWTQAVDRMIQIGFEPVPPFNVYWANHGRTFEDPDGYRIVLQNAGWDNQKALEQQT